MGIPNQTIADLLGGKVISQEIVNKIMNLKAAEYEESGKQFDEAAINKLAGSMLKVLDSLVNTEKEYKPNEFIFEYDGAKFLTKGDLHTIGAKHKGGKTSLIYILIACMLSGSWNKLKCIIPDLKVVCVDTEQKGIDTQNALLKICKMANVDPTEVEQRLHMFNFRPLTPDEMKLGIHLLLQVYKPDILFVDGIVDLCRDFNDVEASQDLVINYLLKIADEHNCAIINVLHTNKTDGYQELRGHLGAFLAQKGNCVFKCEQDPNTHIVTVSLPTVRYAPVPDFYFTFDKDGMPIDAEQHFLEVQAEMAKNAKLRKEEEKRQKMNERKDVILELVKANGGSSYRKDVRKSFCDKTGKGETTFNETLNEMLEAEVLFESGPRNQLVLSLHKTQEIPGLK